MVDKIADSISYTPHISIITVSYNAELFIRQTIESILSQTYSEFEYIIVDDCSTDRTWQIINEYDDVRIKKIRNDENISEYANRNKALAMATGDYVIFIDGEDIMFSHAVEVFGYYIKLFPACALIVMRDWDPRILYPFLADSLTMYRFEFLDKGLTGGNFTKVLFKRTEIINAGGLRNDIKTGDTYIQLKIATTANTLVISNGFTWWRRRKQNASQTLFRNERHVAETVNYRIELLDAAHCPLSAEEIEISKNNIYGTYMRQLVRIFLLFKFGDLVYLLKHVKIPGRFYKSILIPAQYKFFDTYSGDNPLQINSGIK